jgi:Ca-activated chloride channel family protein
LLLLEMLVGERKHAVINKQPAMIRQIDKGLFLLLLVVLPGLLFAQSEKSLIRKGNEAYEKKEYEAAFTEYKKAAEMDPGNTIATYNMGNALYRNKKYNEAEAAFQLAADGSRSVGERAKAFYNKGVTLQNNNKLPECINAYKKALKLNPVDEDARQNLQKALEQQRQQQQKDKKDKQEKQPKEDRKDPKKQKREEDKKNEQPKPRPDKMSKQDAEEKLKALLQQEKNLQDKLKKVNAASPEKPEKDW